jgi:hypothetical protein
MSAYLWLILVPPPSTLTWLQFGDETSWDKGAVKPHADGRLVGLGYNQYAAAIT